MIADLVNKSNADSILTLVLRVIRPREEVASSLLCSSPAGAVDDGAVSSSPSCDSPSVEYTCCSDENSGTSMSRRSVTADLVGEVCCVEAGGELGGKALGGVLRRRGEEGALLVGEDTESRTVVGSVIAGSVI